ncbi:centrosomal protein of 128 kDa isoform X5 [Loxodonta africana]|uniref:centrosomal protein of 128 kDa isoform X5 n=1 Tax=Loxodonta africana TaxID=9785 RepID=UPI0030CF6FB4
MAESSSDSDCFRHQDQLSRWATRSTHRGTQNHPTVDVTKKVNTITSTLQDTSRNLRQVDQMLGHYREYSNEQAGAIEQLKESLEQSIGQLRNRRLLRNSGGRSISVTSLSPSDLDGGAAAESHRFPPTSPLKDYGDPQGSKPMKSRPAGVRFVRENDDLGQLHILHQSLRDLSSEQVRLGDDLNREFSRRSRSDAETKRALEELTEKLNVQRQEVISDRVERRLQEIEREMRTERELVEKRQDQLGLMSLQLQEALKKQEAKADENEDVMKNKLRQTEAEKSQLEQELELSRRLLNQSEGSRETLMYQIEELRTQLMKAEGDRKGLQHQVSQISKQQSNHQDEQADDWRFRRGIEREKQGLEKQMSDVRAELNFNAMASELEEVKRCMERKDKEKAHLAVEVEILKERDESKSQLFAALQQIDSLRKELNDVLSKRALQEEELDCKEKKLNDVKSHQADLEQEVRDSLDTIHRLESELKKQSKLQSQLKAEKTHLEEENAALKKSQAEDKAKLLEMQESVKDLSAIRADLANKLAEEERAKKEVLKDLSDLKTHEKSREDETATIIKQLKLERDVHQRELKDLTSSLQSVKMKHEQNIQELMKHFKKEKSEAENHIRTLKAESLEDKNTAKVHLWQLEKLKSQCDRLTQELAQNEEENKKLKLKYQCLKEQLEEKEKHISNEEENLRRMEEARLQLKDQLLCLETEQESIFGMIGKEIDTACKTFWRDSVEKLKVFSSVPDIHFDPHRWLAESKTKLQWLCEELKERESREKSLRHQLMLCRQQLKDMTENKECELQYLFEQIERQEQLLEEIHREKRDLLDENHRKDAEVESLQPKLLFKIPPWEDASHTAVKNQSEAQFEEKADRVIALETSTRVALDHLESVPEKLSLLEDFKDFRESCGLSERPDGSYSKYKMQRDSPRLHRDDAKYRIKSFQDDGSHVHGLDHSSSWQDHSSFLSSPRFSHLNSFTKRAASVDSASIKEDPTSLTMNGKSLQSKKEESENKKSKIKTTNS